MIGNRKYSLELKLQGNFRYEKIEIITFFDEVYGE